MRELSVRIEERERVDEIRIVARELVIAGWTGRDRKAREEHIRELEALGVARPATTPVYYRVSAARLSTAPAIEASGADSSGEVEFVLLGANGRMHVGVGSDHTDRKVERYGVTVSKQMCDKPIGASFWPHDEVADHWDELILRSYVIVGGERRLYQEGAVATMMTPEELVRGYTGGERLGDGVVLFGGTLPAHGGVRPAERFEAELEDPRLGRRIAFGYDVRVLPVHG